MITVKITWVDKQGNAACLGIDETLSYEENKCPTEEEISNSAILYAIGQEVDLEKFHPEVEFIQE